MAKNRVKREPVVQPLDQSIKLIPLTQKQVTVVDASRYEQLDEWNWCALWNPAMKNFYAVRRGRPGEPKFIYMHAVIAGTEHGHTDHRDRDTLNNRKENLRKATSSQNGGNREKQRNNTAGFKGVFRNKSGWMAKIAVRGQQIYIGQFHDSQSAAAAYNKAALEHFGEFARLNHLPSPDV